jgi:deoxyribonucleoside regulator
MVKINNKQKDHFLYILSKLYYVDKVTQDKLSKMFNLSRASISRFLTEAEKKKIFRISIIDISGTKYKLEEKIKDKYKIKDAIVSVVPDEDEKMLKRSIGRDAAEYINKLLKDDMSIGIAWGTTIGEFINFLEPRPLKNIKVIDLIGIMGNLFTNINASELARRFGKNYNAKNYFLNSLTIVNSKEVRDHLIREEEIRNVLEMQKQLDIAIISIGNVESSALKRLNIGEGVLEDIKANGGVGDICLRFFNRRGNKIKTSFDDKIIGIDLEDFKKIKLKVCISGGLEKLEAIKGMLNGKLIDVLITDSLVANNL